MAAFSYSSSLLLIKKGIEILNAPPHLKDNEDIYIVIKNIANAVQETLKKILSSESIFLVKVDLEYLLHQYLVELKRKEEAADPFFLSNELILQERCKDFSKCVQSLLKEKIESISEIASFFMALIWDYISSVVLKVLEFHTADYPQLYLYWADVAQVILKKKEEGIVWVEHNLEMEKAVNFTINSKYDKRVEKLKEAEDSMMKAIAGAESPGVVYLHGFGEKNLNHLVGVDASTLHDAFDILVQVKAYWKIVNTRLVDSLGIYVYYTIQKLFETEIHSAISNGLSKIVNENGDDPPIIYSSKLLKLEDDLKKLLLEQQTNASASPKSEDHERADSGKYKE